MEAAAVEAVTVETEAVPAEDEDIVSRLFLHDLDEVLQRLFLCLDPASLRAAKCVCQAWREFISVRVWGAAPARRQLAASLARAWRHHQPRHTVYTRTRVNPVNFVVCDDRSVVCGYNGGNMARLFDIQTGEKRLQLDCGRELQPVLNFPRDGSVQLDLGSTVLATVTDGG